MKRSRLSYDEWKCIKSKKLKGKQVSDDFFKGYIGLVEIEEVSEKQIWKFNGKDIIVCDNGLQWLSVLPQNDFYCITAMMNENNDILLWYIDMIAEQGIDVDGVPYFDDLYLDLVVYPDGTIIVDDMDELEEAISAKDITQEQFNLAISTSNKLKNGLLSNIDTFIEYTLRCKEMVELQDVIARIQQMEQYFDEVLQALDMNPEAIYEDTDLQHILEILSEYMDSGQWMLDYEYDERGELPENLKRGVLSQDALYDLLCGIANDC